RTFIVEPKTKQLIAASAGSLIIEDSKDASRVLATESSDSIIADASQYLEKRELLGAAIDKQLSFRDRNRDTQFIDLRVLEVGTLKWQLVMTISETELLSDVTKAIYVSVIASLGGILLALAISILFGIVFT